jgi:ferredoxin--NADP+ reductase
MVVDNKAIVTYVQLLKEDLLIMRIVPKDGPVPDFEAGQFLTLGLSNPLDGGKIVRRAYSIASHPENKEYIEFVIRWVRKPLPGRLTTQIFNVKEGDEILWLKPTGKALGISQELASGEKDTRRIVCIGGGTGLAPFVSFAQHLHDTNDKREIVVLHGASYVDELSYKQLLTDLENESIDKGKDKWNFKYRAAISRPEEWTNRAWNGHKGRIEQFLRSNDDGKSPLDELVGEKITKDNTMFYVCGWQGTIDGTMDYLKTKNFVTEKNKREDGSYEVKFESYG